jgi:uncharacterized protein
MERKNVKSSVIASVGWAPVLEVEFKNGGVYQYIDVPEDTFNELVSSKSKGKYLDAYIKGEFDCFSAIPVKKS